MAYVNNFNTVIKTCQWSLTFTIDKSLKIGGLCVGAHSHSHAMYRYFLAGAAGVTGAVTAGLAAGAAALGAGFTML
jgi:hypothetical protein